VARDKVVLAYSGGLDTSVAVKWIREKYDLDVVTYTCDLGQGRELETIKAKALKTGAVDAVIEDCRNMFVDYFVWPSLMAGTLYEGKYPLATALGRPLIALRMVEVAKECGAVAVAHGCTGKGNDQVRFDVAVQTLAPHLKVIAPVREWRWTRSEEVDYAAKHGIEVQATKQSIFSVDQNLWGRSIEAGVLEDPWVAPPPETYQWTVDPLAAPDKPLDVEIEFDQGRPTQLNGETMDGAVLIEKLNTLGGQHGVGRIDHVENRLVGIKSREIYEAPAAMILHKAHQELEFLTLSRQAHRFKTYVSQTAGPLSTLNRLDSFTPDRAYFRYLSNHSHTFGYCSIRPGHPECPPPSFTINSTGNFTDSYFSFSTSDCCKGTVLSLSPWISNKGGDFSVTK